MVRDGGGEIRVAESRCAHRGEALCRERHKQRFEPDRSGDPASPKRDFGADSVAFDGQPLHLREHRHGAGRHPHPEVLNMDWRERIVCDPDILVGKPTIKGTRLSVELILGWLARGWTHGTLIEAYPQPVRDHILAALAFAAEKMREESYTLLSSPASSACH